MPDLYLGIDGGQSSTTALIGDESGRVLGHGRGGPCNHVSGPEARTTFLSAIGGCVRAALAQAGLPPDKPHFAAACFGFSGGAGDKAPLLDEILTTGKRHVTHDALIALSGATAGEPGIIVIAGTGSIAFGRGRHASRTARVGGWGYAFGDEGGGYDITRQALRAALKFEEGWGPRTSLHEILLTATGARDADDLLHRFYTPDFPRPRIASFAKLVDAAALAGDTVAGEILNQAARELADFADAVRQQLFVEHEPARVAHIGGVFQSDLLRQRFVTLVDLTDGNLAGPPLLEPAAGALLEAYRLSNLTPTLTNLPAQEKS